MKKWRSFISALLAGIMILSAATGIFAAPAFTDVSNHWAWTRGYIPYLVEKNVLNGYKLASGTSVFKPEDKVTRAEFIKMLDETFGLVETAEVPYLDVKATDWHHPYFAKAIAQGYILNYGSYATPNGQLTREEAITLLVRYLDLSDAEKAPASTFADYNSITSYYRDPVMAAVKAGLIEGYAENGKTYFKPQNTLTRAEALTILYRAAGAIYNANASVKDSGAADTNAVITKGGVILSNLTLNGRVIVSEGASGYTVTLDNTTVTDTLYVRGKSNVIINGKSVKNLIVDSSVSGLLITLTGGAKVENLIMNSSAKVAVSSGTSVGTLTVNAKNSSVTGAGAIETMNINANGMVSSIMPDNYHIADGIAANLDGNAYEGSSDNLASFVFQPFLTEEDNHTYLNVSPAVSGQIYYYFTDVSIAPSAKDFDAAYLTANYRDSFAVKANKVYCESVGLSYHVDDYDYIVIQVANESKNYTPVIIPNEVSSGTGFRAEPELIDDTTISFTAEYSGSAYYYYSDSVDKVSTAQFLNNYNSIDKEFKGTVAVSGSSSTKIELKSRYLENYPYIVILLQKGNNAYYTPVVVAVGDNGFSEEPTVTAVGTISFTTKVTGTLYYYYSASEKAPAATDYNDAWRKDTNRGQMSVVKGYDDSVEYSENTLKRYPYIIFSIKDADGNYTKPFVLHIKNTSGFQLDPYVSGTSEISLRTVANGTLYWYMSKTASVPANINEFTSNYYSAANSRRGDERVFSTSLTTFKYPAEYASTYPYIVLRLQGTDGTEYLPVVLDVKDSSSTGFIDDPTISNTGDYIHFRTSESGTVYYYYVKKTAGSSDFTQDFQKMYNNTPSAYRGNKDVGTAANYIDYSSIDVDTYNGIVICFVSDDGVEHTPIYLALEKNQTGSGSKTGIEVISINDENISLYVDYTGTLAYIFKNNDKTPSKAEFNYASAKVSVTKNELVTIPLNEDYDYIALKLENCEPIVVDLRYKMNEEGNEDGANVRDTGFVSCSSKVDEVGDITITFIPKTSGIVYISSTVSYSAKEMEVVAGETYTYSMPYNDLIDLMGGTYYIQLVSGSVIYERINLTSR